MDSSEIGMIIIGVVLIAVGIFGMVRPDILYRNVGGKKAFGSGFRLFGFSAARRDESKVTPEAIHVQRWWLLCFILCGVMLILVNVVYKIPLWEEYQGAILLSIIIVMSIVMSFLFWKIVLSNNERFKGIGFAITMLFCFALIAIVVYYWISILK
jgi:hypothetical protein